MHRHVPALFPHPENPEADDIEDYVDDESLAAQSWATGHLSNHYNSSQNLSGSIKLRMKQRSPTSFSTATSNTLISSKQAPTSHAMYKYSDVYSQFVKRYRSRPNTLEDVRSMHFGGIRNPSLWDADSDEERPGSPQGTDTRDRFTSPLLDQEVPESVTIKERERLEWQSMLASVLGGDVLKSEKSRIQFALLTSTEAINIRHLDTWLSLRAQIRGRTVEEEKVYLEERRLRVVNVVINEVLNFRVTDGAGTPLQQVHAVLRHLDLVHSLYPHLKAFYLDKPAAASADFQLRCDALTTWSNVLSSLRQQIALLRRWTGSETLDVTERSTPDTGNENEFLREHNAGSTFVERLMKEETIQRTFEKGFLTTVHALIASARDTQVNMAEQFKLLNLPTFEEELVQLISFPTRLVHACLRLRLEYASKVTDPDVIIIDQMLEDFRLTIGLACTLKRQYEAFLLPDPDGNWNLPSCISEDYDAVVLEALTVFFRLINWKLKSGSKDIYFRETEVLEAQWTTFNDVSLTVTGGASLIAEQICSITNKLMIRATNNFERQIRLPIVPEHDKSRTPQIVFTPPRSNSPANMNGLGFDLHKRINESGKNRALTGEQLTSWYEKVLESVKARYRKLRRFSRALSQRFHNSAEYSLENVAMDQFIACLVESDHFLVYTQSFEEEGTYIVASRGLRDRSTTIKQMLQDPSHVNPLWEDGYRTIRPNGLSVEGDVGDEEQYDDVAYLLILSPRVRFLWNGLVLMLPLPRVDLDLRDNRVRLVADGPLPRLVLAKDRFTDLFVQATEDVPTGEGELAESGMDSDGQGYVYLPPLTCVVEQMAHLSAVNRELRKISRVTNRLAEAIVDAVHYIRKALSGVVGCADLLESWYSFASEHGQHAQKYMDRASWLRFNRLLIKLAISWVSFICDDCDPSDRKTFRWAVSALEFVMLRTKRNNILQIPDDQFEMLRQKVASCMTLLISHFDILGARSNLEAKKEWERQEELSRLELDSGPANENETDFWEAATPVDEEDSFSQKISSDDRNVRRFREDILRHIKALDERRAGLGSELRVVGRVLDDQKPEDKSLAFLASATSNISIRWQQGKFIGAGAFGSVYTAVNLDTGGVIAVKEIRVQESAGMTNLYQHIQDELKVMEMLRHPNVVEYYGIEVHRDKVFIFEEYCECGSLAQTLELGRITDENILQVYTMQMLEGLAYLHGRGIVHRDVKPDNILLDHNGVLKFVDFGASKVFAKGGRTLHRTRPGAQGGTSHIRHDNNGLKNSLTGTPMYMSPEVIKNDKRGRHGAMDIWSMGCVILECATGRKPWSHLDNEWAIMFHIGVTTQHPPLPEKNELCEKGIDFIKFCLTIDPISRPTAEELMDHPWMLAFIDTLRRYEEEDMTSPPVELPSEQDYEGATVAKHAAIIQEKEIEAIKAETPPISDASNSPLV